MSMPPSNPRLTSTVRPSSAALRKASELIAGESVEACSEASGDGSVADVSVDAAGDSFSVVGAVASEAGSRVAASLSREVSSFEVSSFEVSVLEGLLESWLAELQPEKVTDAMSKSVAIDRFRRCSCFFMLAV